MTVSTLALAHGSVRALVFHVFGQIFVATETQIRLLIAGKGVVGRLVSDMTAGAGIFAAFRAAMNVGEVKALSQVKVTVHADKSGRKMQGRGEKRTVGIVTGCTLTFGIGLMSALRLRVGLLVTRRTQSLLDRRDEEFLVVGPVWRMTGYTALFIENRKVCRLLIKFPQCFVTGGTDLFDGTMDHHFVSKAVKLVTGIAVLFFKRTMIEFAGELVVIVSVTLETFLCLLCPPGLRRD